VSAPEKRYVDLVFLDEAGTPQLARCALLFLDLLGVTEMARSPHAQQNLVDLEQAIRGLQLRDFLDPDSAWPAAIFSDTLVMAAPTELFGGDDAAVTGLLLQVSSLQLSLAERGFFARGSITLGEFYLRDELVFGETLVEAYELENNFAIHPRVILSPEVLEAQRQNQDIFVTAGAGQSATFAVARPGWPGVRELPRDTARGNRQPGAAARSTPRRPRRQARDLSRKQPRVGEVSMGLGVPQPLLQ
jgi:hypothetical protein